MVAILVLGLCVFVMPLPLLYHIRIIQVRITMVTICPFPPPCPSTCTSLILHLIHLCSIRIGCVDVLRSRGRASRRSGGGGGAWSCVEDSWSFSSSYPFQEMRSVYKTVSILGPIRASTYSQGAKTNPFVPYGSMVLYLHVPYPGFKHY